MFPGIHVNFPNRPNGAYPVSESALTSPCSVEYVAHVKNYLPTRYNFVTKQQKLWYTNDSYFRQSSILVNRRGSLKKVMRRFASFSKRSG